MSRQGWVECLMASEADGPPLSASVSATSIIPSGARAILPANWADIGRKLKFHLAGRISTLVTTPGTFTFDLRLGTIASSIVVANLGATQLNAVAQTNVSWWLDATFTVRAIGSGTAANGIGMAHFTSQAVVGGGTGVAGAATVGGAGTSSYSQTLPQTAPAVGTGFDSTVSNAVDVFGTWSVNSASNSITVHEYELLALN